MEISTPVPVGIATASLDSEHLDLGHLSDMHEIWQRLRGDRLLPSWPAFDIRMIGRWWGSNILLETVPETPERFLVRLWGVKLAELFGEDLTGRVIPALDAARSPSSVLFDHAELFSRLMQHPRFAILSGTMPPVRGARSSDGEQRRFSCLVMPLGNDGETPDRLLLTVHVER